jgi:Protein of unknown function (DUF2975)
MNTSEIAPKTNLRMNRIRIVSRIAKWIVLAFLFYSIVFFLRLSSGPASFLKSNVWRTLFNVMFQVVLWFWYWKLARLFDFYKRGLIFAAETIRCIKFLGLLCAVGWMLMSINHFLLQQYPLPSIQSMLDHLKTLPPGVTLREVSVTHYQMGFFSFDFGTGINFGLLFAGIVIVLIAWIMDEGRKIQEEQELTV